MPSSEPEDRPVPTALQRHIVERVGAEVARLRDDPAAAAAERDVSEIAQPDHARAALRRVEQVAGFSPTAPVESRRPLGRAVKSTVARLVQFYIVHVVREMASFATAVARFGRSVLDDVAAVSARVDALERKVDAMAESRDGNPDAAP